MIGIVDYGVGNLFSLKSSFAFIGAEAAVVADPGKLSDCERILLPGVGAFRDAARKLRDTGMAEAGVREAAGGKPLMGVCLGMQLLFERSFEYGAHEGLGLIRGSVKPIAPVVGGGLKVPQIGWNALRFPAGQPGRALFRYIDEGSFVYFVHSYAAMDCDDSVIAYTDYGAPLTAAVARKNVFGCQFHPEKSGEVGLNILRAFCEV
jgi:glutamine amidotransferase